MKKKLSFLSVFVFLLCFNTYSQQASMGFKFDLIKIIWYKESLPYERSMTAYPAIFLKLGFFLTDKFELELDGGYQFGERFTGLEGAVLAKYEVWENISPFVAYFSHANREHVGHGDMYIYNYEFFGAGAELRLTKIFGVDLGYYYPVGESGFDHRYSVLDDRTIVSTSQISSFLRFGINFSFY